jgi:hypothetical protein
MSTLVRRLAWSQVVWSSLALSAAAAPPEKPAGLLITPSEAVTHFTAPLDREGYVDFHAALNAELGKGVAPTENAVIPLLQAMGPCEGRADTINLVLQALGAAPWSPGMTDFRDFGDITRNDAAASQRLNDEQSQAMSVPWVSADHPEVAALLTENEAALAAIAAAVQKPKYFRPMVVSHPEHTLISVMLPDIQSSRGVARQLVCRAMRHLGEGRPLDAQQDLLTVHRLGRCIGQGACLIEALVGIAIDATASTADNVWAAHPDLTADQVAAYRGQLAALPPISNMARCIDLTERAMCMDVTQAIARGRFNNEHNSFNELLGLTNGNGEPAPLIDAGQFARTLMVMSVDWNVTMRTLNRTFDDLLKASTPADRSERKALLGRFEDQLKQTKSDTATFKTLATVVVGGSSARGKTFGNVLSTLLMPGVWNALSAQDGSQARRDLLQVMLSLAEYQRREGKFPESLAALAPQYLAVVPDDLFAGKPFRYTSDGSSYQLYSIGRNERDDGGKMGTPTGADDLLMAYPPPVR